MKKAIILAGGAGSRLRPLTTVLPKPLTPVGDISIIECIVRWLALNGISDIAVSLGYLGYTVQAVLGDGKRLGVNLHYVQEEKPLGTAGPLALLRDWIGADDAFVSNGDLLTKIDLNTFYANHQTSGAFVTVATRRHKAQSAFGVMHAAKNGRLLNWVEKPITSEIVGAGMYIVKPEAVDMIPPDTKFDMPDIIRRVMSRKKLVQTELFTEPWLAVENLNDHTAAVNNEEWIRWVKDLKDGKLNKPTTEVKA